jgi:hypothetical protein
VLAAGGRAAAATALSALGDVIAVPDRAFDGAALLACVPSGGIEAVTKTLRGIGASIRSAALVGSHATRYTVAHKR